AAAHRPPASGCGSAPAPRAATGDAALWAAFCAGAGVELPLPPGELEPRLRLVGMLLNRAVAGMLQLMAVRASTKHEMRAEVTVIRQVSNNPLKFSPDAKAGIEQLVQPASRGFLDGAAAVDDAMHDLVGHSIGTVAGMRAAIEGLLDRFDPAALEARLAPPSRLETMLPGQRKARLWDEYLRRYGEIRGDAQEDFHSVFGKAFVAAYEQQVERLKRGGR
ncbi:MAG: type VI secretion system-associated FHA domain protein TagH, partial [Burkholderiales bacterium]|nr:type VI secretion system-associated FHA domain protein TagH [Burkholderiales bacterium]